MPGRPWGMAQPLDSIDRNLLLDVLRAAAPGSASAVRSLAMDAAKRVREGGDPDAAKEIETLYAASRRDEFPIGLFPLKPKKTMDQLKLPIEVQEAVRDFLTEQRNVEALAKAGLPPRHKCLFIGPPGNGKTVLAGAIAQVLDIPSFMVRYDDLISNRPGETSRNLLQIFDFARQRPTLLFFDEFDALGRERDDAQESGEMKRVTSTLLVQIDDLPPHVVAIAATNHGQMLDAAIWRRFNIRIELPRPRLEEFQSFMRDMFNRFGHDPQDNDDITLDLVGYRMIPENFSDAELFVSNCVRLHVIANNEGNRLTIEECILIELEKWSAGQKKVIV